MAYGRLPKPRAPTRAQLLELDIDVRLAGLWREALEIDEWNLSRVAAFIRAAYAKGYCDALGEGERGALCVEHGYPVPQPASPARRTAAHDAPAPLPWER